MKKLYSIILLLFIITGCEKASSDANFAGGPASVGQGGSLARFTIVGNYLYTVDKENLRVFDVTDPTTPVFKRSIAVGFAIETIFPFKDKLFIGSTSVVHIFSIDDPANPVKVGTALSPTVLRRCDPVVAKDTVAYATLRTNGPCGGTQSILAVYDIHDATNPIHRTEVPLVEPYGLGYSGNTLYVCDKVQGLVVFDIASAYLPKRLKNVTLPDATFIDVIPVGQTLVCWTTRGMALYDITNPIDPTLIKQII